jgi:hypothetical protein
MVNSNALQRTRLGGSAARCSTKRPTGTFAGPFVALARLGTAAAGAARTVLGSTASGGVAATLAARSQ